RKYVNRPKESLDYQCRFRGVHWIFCRPSDVSERTDMRLCIVRRRIKLLIDIGLIEAVKSEDMPPEVLADLKRWFGPNTRMIRVRYELAFDDVDVDEEDDDDE